jgi:hypothetical protein
MNKKQTDLIKSALRHFVLVAIAVYQVTGGDAKAFAYGLAAAIIGPAIRGVDKSDPAFGKVADWVPLEIDKLAKADKKKKTK